MADADNDDNNSLHSASQSNKGSEESKDDRLNSRSENSSSKENDNEVRREVKNTSFLKVSSVL